MQGQLDSLSLDCGPSRISVDELIGGTKAQLAIKLVLPALYKWFAIDPNQER